MRRRDDEVYPASVGVALNSSLIKAKISLVSLIHALAVADHLNFRHAAASLGVSQSSVSQRIQQLEDVLGISLFERRHRGVVLTEAGRYFLQHVATGIDHLEHAVKTAGMSASGGYGHLRVGVQSTPAAGFLNELFSEFQRSHPSVDFQVDEGRARESIKHVRQEHLDIAFVIGSPAAQDCHTRQLWTERLFVALPKDHKLAEGDGVFWRDLAQETFIIRHNGIGPDMHDHLLRRLSEWGSQPEIRQRKVERDTLMYMIAQGQGIALATEAKSMVAFSGVAFKPILDEPEPVVFSAVWSPFNRSQVLRHLLELAQRHSRMRS